VWEREKVGRKERGRGKVFNSCEFASGYADIGSATGPYWGPRSQTQVIGMQFVF